MTQASLSAHREPVARRYRGASVLAICLVVFGLFAVVTGGTDVVLGPHLLVANGAPLGSSINDPWLDSQLRFLGAMWAGWGVMLIWTCRDLHARAHSPALLVFFTALELVVSTTGVFLRRLLIATERPIRPSQV